MDCRLPFVESASAHLGDPAVLSLHIVGPVKVDNKRQRDMVRVPDMRRSEGSPGWILWRQGPLQDRQVRMELVNCRFALYRGLELFFCFHLAGDVVALTTNRCSVVFYDEARACVPKCLPSPRETNNGRWGNPRFSVC